MAHLKIISVITITLFVIQAFVKKFKIGRFYYSIHEEKSYIHDDDLHATYFIVRKIGSKKNQCSAFKIAVRNDTVFTKGSFAIMQSKIVFTERYFHVRNVLSLDSSTAVFYPDKNGNLVLKEYTVYRKGKTSRNTY